MVASSRAQVNGKTPVHALYQSYFGGLEAFGQAYDPFIKGFARAQLEFMGLMNRRAQAYMEIPSRLSQCRTPQDLLSEQMRFWQSAGQEYSEYVSHVMQAMGAISAPSFGVPVEEGVSARDYITFPEAKEPEERPARGRERRRAA